MWIHGDVNGEIDDQLDQTSHFRVPEFQTNTGLI